MDISEYIIPTPWDSKTFGISTFEIQVSPNKEIFHQVLNQVVISNKPGHYTVKVDPVTSKKLLHEYGFYYCDTLLEPYCKLEELKTYTKTGISLSKSVSLDALIEVCHGAFIHGRFHRDFNLDKVKADIRYDSWLQQLYGTNNVFGLMYNENLAGFWGFSQNKIILHALDKKYRGKGMAKYFWSLACQELFQQGYSEITSSISAANVAVLNLYCSLGFKFKNPLDVYHLLVK